MGTISDGWLVRVLTYLKLSRDAKLKYIVPKLVYFGKESLKCYFKKFPSEVFTELLRVKCIDHFAGFRQKIAFFCKVRNVYCCLAKKMV